MAFATRKSRNTVIAIGNQSVRGTFVDPAANVMPVSNVSLGIASVAVANPEYTGSIDQQGDEIAGKKLTLSFDVNLRPPGGSDVPAANAYLLGLLFQNAKMSEVRTTSAIPASPEALSSGSTTGFTGGAGVTGTLDLYKAMLVQLLGVSSGFSGISAIRTNSASKVFELCETFGSSLSGNYQIPKQLAYVNSVSSVDPVPLSATVWIGGVCYDLVDCQVASLLLSVQTSTRDSATIPMARITMDVTLYDYADESTPTIPALGTTPKFQNGKQFLSKIAVGGSGFELNFGLQSAAAPNPNMPTGDEGGELVSKQITLTPTLLAYAKADFDTIAKADAQAKHSFFAMWGSGAGGIVAIVIPDARFSHSGPDIGQQHVMESPQLWVDVLQKGAAIVFPYPA